MDIGSEESIWMDPKKKNQIWDTTVDLDQMIEKGVKNRILGFCSASCAQLSTFVFQGQQDPPKL